MLTHFWYRDQMLRLHMFRWRETLVTSGFLRRVEIAMLGMLGMSLLFSSFTHSIIHINNHRRHHPSTHAIADKHGPV